jgi:D-amino-acid dehydrogenase
LLVECGHFVLWESARSARQGREHWHSAKTGPATVRDASNEELESLRGLTRANVHGAIRFAGTGQFTDPGSLLAGMETSIRSAGVKRVMGTVSAIERGDGNRERVRTVDGATYEADAVVIAAGVASGALLAPTGLAAPIIAERGYHIQAPDSAWPAGMPPVVFEDRSLIVTNFRSALRASGFVEFARADRPPDPSRWAVLEAHVRELGLPFGAPMAHWMGPRPTLPDYLPAIGRSPSRPGLCYAFGHQHLGLTMAALTGEIVRDLVTGRTPVLDIRPFDLTRFGRI